MTEQKKNRFYNAKGEVGVLYSPGYGLGSPLSMEERLGPAFVAAVLEDPNALEELVPSLAPETPYPAYHAVAWVPAGETFFIDEYDGHETVHVVGQTDSFQFVEA